MKFIGAHIFDYDATFRSNVNITGNLDVDGTINIDAADIDGNLQLDGTLTVGVDDTGYDVKFYGDTASKYMLWDASADQLNIIGSVGIGTSSPGFKLTVDETTTNNLTVAHFKHNQGGVISNILLENSAGADNTGFDINFKLASSGAAAKIGAIRTNSPGAGDTDMFFSTSTNGTSVTEKMRLSSGGNLLLGTTVDSGSKLVVADLSNFNSSDVLALQNKADQIDEYVGLSFQTAISSDGIQAAIRSINGPSSNDVRLGFFTSSTSGASVTEALSIDHAGKVGIGTSSPSQKLTVEGNIELGTGGYIYGDTTTPYLRLNNAAGAVLGYSNGYISLGPTFVYNNASGEQFRIRHSDGSVGIGTSNPASKLDVRGTVQVGVDDTGHDVIFYGATSGKKMQWDESADTLILTGTLDVSNGELIPKSITMPHVSDPSDPADGRSVIWNDTSGNLKIKINVGGSVVTKTIVTYE